MISTGFYGFSSRDEKNENRPLSFSFDPDVTPVLSRSRQALSPAGHSTRILGKGGVENKIIINIKDQIYKKL